ncbi:MAG TPA: hypothetical protein ENH35_02850 [Candidatus Moranbacteria bacterium]|nr:hypothetical protein [Candidatus Moranbacteria bacterium]
MLKGLGNLLKGFFTKPEKTSGSAKSAEKKAEEEKKKYDVGKIPRWLKDLGYIVFLGGSLLFVILGSIIGHIFEYASEGAVSGLILWSSIYIALGIDIVPQKMSRVYERFGKPVKINRAGPHLTCLKGIIDKLAVEVSHQYHVTNLFTGKEGDPSPKIDFAEGTTAKICAETWWRVEDTIDSILRFAYEVSDPEGFIRQQFDTLIRPHLQKHSADEAQLQKNEIASKIIEELSPRIAELTGIELEPIKGLLIRDIELPEKVVNQRFKRLEGTTEAEKDIHRGKGYINAILAIKEAAKKDGTDIDLGQAQRIFERQRGLETIEKTGANVTFISPGIGGVLKTLDIAPERKYDKKRKEKTA